MKIKKSTKRILSSFICMVLILSSSVPGFAASANDKEETQAENYSLDTAFEGVKRSSDGKYALEVVGDERLPVGRLDIDLSSEKAVSSVMSRGDVSKEAKDEISRQSQKAIANNQSLRATLFSAELLPNSESSIYYTYNGHPMRSDRLYTYGVSTGWEYIDSGSQTYVTADGIINLLLLAGSSSTILGFVSAGKTVLDFFIDQWGSSYITGHRDDYLQMRLIYDDVKQWTYAQQGDEWYLGLCTQKVTVTKVGTEQYYFNGTSGKTTTKDVTTNKSQESEHYASPWATAYQWQNYPLTEWLDWEVDGRTFVF